MPAPEINFEGVANLFGGWPPDTQGDIGTNHYIQWVNLHFSIWSIDRVNLTATLVYGPVSGKTLWQGFGGVCETRNDGDPITLYDSFADRWFMSQFALPYYPNGPFYQCVAVSQTPDPTGAWYRYQYQWPSNKMNDYPKFGVWPDAYYMSVNQFTGGSTWAGAGVAALERSAMLAGSPARMIFFDLADVSLDYGGLLPADFDGKLNPPAGSPGIFIEWDDAAWIGPEDALRLWEFQVDWTTPANSIFGGSEVPNQTINTNNVDPDMCYYSRSCISQPGTGTRVDALSDRLMYRLQYRNFGDHESLVSNHTVDVTGYDRAGIHWFELRRSTGDWSLHQEGVYSPDAFHRWMGSIAMDHSGNMALGYSVSSGILYPSIRYTGRLANDALGTLPQGEVSLIEGGGSQTGSSRWGDYSMMAVDPVDDCTFWYTQQYVQTTGTNSWRTRIGAFRFPECSLGSQGSLSGAVREKISGSGINGAMVEIEAQEGWSVSTKTDDDGTYTLQAPVGVYTTTASAFGYSPQTIPSVAIQEDQVTTQDFSLEMASWYHVTGVVRDSLMNWPVYAKVSLPGTPVEPAWTNPVTGAFDFQLPGDIAFTLRAEAFIPGYLPGSVDIAPLVGNFEQDILLEADLTTCIAPGYAMGEDCGPHPGGLVVGHVYDANTNQALLGALVYNNSGYQATTQETPLDPLVPDGFYVAFSPESGHIFTATMSGGYQAVTADVIVEGGGAVQQDFSLPAGKLTAIPDALNVIVKLGRTATIPVIFENSGGAGVKYQVVEIGGQAAAPGHFDEPTFGVKPFKADLPTSQGLGVPSQPIASPLSAGTVIQIWAPLDTLEPWGVVYDPVDDSVWVSSPAPAWSGEDALEEYTPSGDFTDRRILHTMPHSSGPADLAYNWNTHKLWVMNIYTNVANCIYEVDPDTGYTGNAICPGGGSGFEKSQRGLAYDPTSDTWFAGGWNDLMIYRFDSAGNILSSKNTGLAIAGLAYNPVTQHLFAITSSASTRVYVLDVANDYAILGHFSISQDFGAYTAGGLEFDCTGNLWAVDQGANLVAQIVSGEEVNLCQLDVPWLSEVPEYGTISPQSQETMEVSFDAGVPSIDVGQYFAQLKIQEDTPYLVSNIPVTMTVIPLEYGVSVSPNLSLRDLPGLVVTYTMELTNTGEGPTDTFNLILGEHTWETTTSQATIGPLDMGESALFKVAVHIPWRAASGEFDQVVLTAISTGDASKKDSLTLTTICKTGPVDLELTKQGPLHPLMINTPVTFTLVITNHAETSATGVVVQDLLPHDLQYLYDDSGCQLFSRLLTCTIGRLFSGEIRLLHIVTKPIQTGSLENTAWVSAEQYDPFIQNNSDSAWIWVMFYRALLPWVIRN